MNDKKERILVNPGETLCEYIDDPDGISVVTDKTGPQKLGKTVIKKEGKYVMLNEDGTIDGNYIQKSHKLELANQNILKAIYDKQQTKYTDGGMTFDDPLPPDGGKRHRRSIRKNKKRSIRKNTNKNRN